MVKKWFYENLKISQGGNLVLVHTWSWVFRDMFLVLRGCNTRCSHSGIGLKWRHIVSWAACDTVKNGRSLSTLILGWSRTFRFYEKNLSSDRGWNYSIRFLRSWRSNNSRIIWLHQKPNHQKTKVMWATNSSYVHHLNASYNPSLHGSIISHHFKCPTLIALLDSQ